jgi:simple sugar transport system permease protein
VKEKINNSKFRATLILTIRSIFFGLAFGAIVLLLSGHDPILAYEKLFMGIFSKPKYLCWVVIKSTPIILTGLSVAFAFRTGLFNIGAEGQFMIGTLTATILGVVLDLPPAIHIPIVVMGAMLAAGLFGGFAGWLKGTYGVNEVISTIMLNWIALYLANYFVYLPMLKNPGTESTFDIRESAKINFSWLETITGPGVKNNWGFLIVIIGVIIISFYLFKTTKGFELRAVGYNKHAAKYAGIDMKRAIIRSMFIAGALAGLAGAVQVMGVSYHISKLSISENYGFTGIAVSLLGSNSPVGVIFAGLMFGGMQYGGAKMQFVGVPSEVINIIFGIIILSTTITDMSWFSLKVKNKFIKQREV